jgi:hypothetical protein
VLVEKFGETFYKETGFTEFAETVNGRCAVRTASHTPLHLPVLISPSTQMLGFVAYVGTITKGDILMQLAKFPLPTLVTIALVSGATLVPRVKSDGYFPKPVLDAIRNVQEERLNEIFTERAERVNGRAAVRLELMCLAMNACVSVR